MEREQLPSMYDSIEYIDLLIELNKTDNSTLNRYYLEKLENLKYIIEQERNEYHD